MTHGVAGQARSGAVDVELARQVADTMQALATPSRVRILALLRERPRAVGELVTELGMEQSAISQQLRVLRYLELVVGERRGRQVIYSLHDSHVGVLLEEAVYHIEHVRLGVVPERAASVA